METALEKLESDLSYYRHEKNFATEAERDYYYGLIEATSQAIAYVKEEERNERNRKEN